MKKGQNLFKCDLCSFNCQFKQTLFRHKARTHFDQVKFKFKCNRCRTGFSSRSKYLQHIDTIHKDNGERFKCTIKYKNQGEGNTIFGYECGKTFQLLISARRHLQLLHKIQTKDCEEAKKYFKIVMTSANLFRRSKFSYYVQNKNRKIKEEVPTVVDDPDEILKILENNETDDVESNAPYSSENICIIEEKFIPDVLPMDDANIDEMDDKNDKKQNKEKDIEKPFVKRQKLTGKRKSAVKKRKLVNLHTNKVTTITKLQQLVPKRASLSRSCKNSVEILQSSTRQHFDSQTESENESESDKESGPKISESSDSESELFKSKSLLKVKSPKKVNKNKSPLSCQCQLCGKKLKRKKYLRIHLISSVHPENRVKCIKCPKSHYVVKGTLIKHHKDIINRRKAKKNSDLVPESESDTDFEPEPEIKSKLKISQKDKNSLSCHLCQKIFSKPDHLRHHLVSSLHPENRVECTKCPESHYVVKGTLIKHHKDVKYGRKCLKNIPKSRVKPKDKDFPCTKCHKVFDLNYTLKCHLSYCNVTEKKFSCKECNIFFKTPENLNKHIRTSSRHAPNRGKRYMCQKCSSGFTKAPDLKKHIQAKHENDGTRFECKICCRSYGRYDTLLGHLKKEEHKLREQDFQKKNQDNPAKIKKEEK